jgi:hypothetical protein
MDAGGWYTTICSRMHARFQYFVSIQKPDARALQCRSRTVRCSREQRTRAPPPLVLVAFFWHAPSPACPYSGRGGAPLPDWLASGAGLLLRCDGDAIDRSRLTQHDYQPASSSSPLPSLIPASRSGSHGCGSMHACPVRPCVREEGGAGARRSSHLTHGLSEWRRPRPCEPMLFADPRALPFTGSAVTSCRVTLAVVVKQKLCTSAASVSATTAFQFSSMHSGGGRAVGTRSRRPGSTGVNTLAMHLHVYSGRSSQLSHLLRGVWLLAELDRDLRLFACVLVGASKKLRKLMWAQIYQY